MLTVQTGCSTAVTGGMTEQHLMAVLPVHLTTMTWYLLHSGSFKAIISKLPAMMTAGIATCCTLIMVASEETPSEASLTALVISDMETFGAAMLAEDPVIHTLEVVIYPQGVSAKRHVAAILSLVITCRSGVTGTVATDLWWWLEEEVMAATGRIMGLASQRLILLSLVQAIAMETLEIAAAILAAILSICGLSSFV